MPYGIAVPIIFLYYLVRVWKLHSPMIALVFISLWAAALFGIPLLHLPAFVSPLTVIGLAIVLIFIDRYKTGEAFGLKRK